MTGEGRLRSELGFSFCRSKKGVADVDQVVSDDSESDKSAHSSRSLVAASIHPMAPFEDADTTLATGPPFLSFLEPAFLLTLFALLAFSTTGSQNKTS